MEDPRHHRPDLPRAALWYARNGWRVLPCHPKEKLPAIKGWQRQATADMRQVASWWGVRPASNIGIACGPESGLYVIDVDQHGVDGEKALAAAMKRWGALPETVEQRTGSGGRQLFFAYPAGRDMRNMAGAGKDKDGKPRPGKIGRGVDSRGHGGFVIVPPSIHPCGDAYRWLHGPHERALAELPPTWVAELEKKPDAPRISVPVPRFELMDKLGRETIERISSYVATRGKGERNDSLFWAAKKLARKAEEGVVVWLEAERALLQAAQHAGLDPEETRRTIKSGRDHGRAA